MRDFVVTFRFKRVVQANDPEAVHRWAQWARAGLTEHMPRTDPFPGGVLVLGPAGPDIMEEIEDHGWPATPDEAP